MMKNVFSKINATSGQTAVFWWVSHEIKCTYF